MSNFSEPMIKALRAIAQDSSATFSERTGQALRRRFLIADAPDGFKLTPSGRHALDEHERAERVRKTDAERASRPVPAGAFVEPSARTAPVLGHEYEDETPDTELPGMWEHADYMGGQDVVRGPANPSEDETPDECPAQLAMPDRAPYTCDLDAGHEGDHRGTNGTAVAAWDGRSPYATLEGASEITAERKDGAEFKPAESVTISAGGVPTVPESWIRQLVVLLDADGRIVKTDRGWRVDQRAGSAADAFLYMWDRLDVTVSEAIRRGIAQALPPTPGRGVVRLALVKN